MVSLHWVNCLAGSGINCPGGMYHSTQLERQMGLLESPKHNTASTHSHRENTINWSCAHCRASQPDPALCKGLYFSL